MFTVNLDNNKFYIDTFCHQSYPCSHYCWYEGNETEKKLMTGPDIGKILKSHNKTDVEIYQHFVKYTTDEFYEYSCENGWGYEPVEWTSGRVGAAVNKKK